MSLIHFTRFRSARLDVQLCELSMSQAIEIANIPPELAEASATRFLELAVEQSLGAVQNPLEWTVQERTALVCHYLSHTAEGGRNFEVSGGEKPGFYLDYLDGDSDYPGDSIDLGELLGDKWTMRHITGAHAVVMESVCQTRRDWLVADIAIRMVREGEERPNAVQAAGPFSDWLRERMDILNAMSESEFTELIFAYQNGMSKLHHLFYLSHDKEGFTVMPKPSDREGGAGLPPARFLADNCITDLARALRD